MNGGGKKKPKKDHKTSDSASAQHAKHETKKMGEDGVSVSHLLLSLAQNLLLSHGG